MSDSLPALDRTIPFYNLILRADAPVGEEAGLPPVLSSRFISPATPVSYTHLSLDLERARLIAYRHGDYVALGKKLGFFGYSVASAKVLKRRMSGKENRSRRPHR